MIEGVREWEDGQSETENWDAGDCRVSLAWNCLRGNVLWVVIAQVCTTKCCLTGGPGPSKVVPIQGGGPRFLGSTFLARQEKHSTAKTEETFHTFNERRPSRICSATFQEWKRSSGYSQPSDGWQVPSLSSRAQLDHHLKSPGNVSGSSRRWMQLRYIIWEYRNALINL